MIQWFFSWIAWTLLLGLLLGGQPWIFPQGGRLIVNELRAQ